jgi:hypothetical protein
MDLLRLRLDPDYAAMFKLFDRAAWYLKMRKRGGAFILVGRIQISPEP